MPQVREIIYGKRLSSVPLKSSVAVTLTLWCIWSSSAHAGNKFDRFVEFRSFTKFEFVGKRSNLRLVLFDPNSISSYSILSHIVKIIYDVRFQDLFASHLLCQ